VGESNDDDLLKLQKQLGVVMHAYYPSIWEAKAGGLQVSGQPELCIETLSQNKTVISM
jgi:hypothetical protein